MTEPNAKARIRRLEAQTQAAKQDLEFCKALKRKLWAVNDISNEQVDSCCTELAQETLTAVDQLKTRLFAYTKASVDEFALTKYDVHQATDQFLDAQQAAIITEARVRRLEREFSDL